MAIKSSGQLSLRNDIAAEINGITSNIRLGFMSVAAGFSRPDAMSEFYGYSATPPNDFYFSTRRGQVRNVVKNTNNTTSSTYMGWFRVNSTTKKNQVFFSCGQRATKLRRALMVRAIYISSLNRISVEWYDNYGIRRMRRQYPLHSGGNQSITGVTNSGTGWIRTQRGNTDPDGFVHICVTVDISSRSYTGIQLYWNGNPLLYSVNNESSSVSTTNGISNQLLCIANEYGASIGSTSNFEGGIDNFLWYGSTQLNISEVQTIYNAGNEFPPGVSHPAPSFLDANGYFVYGVQGFEADINNDYGWNLIGDGWETLGSTYSFAKY
jgi:hypothetical protein